MKSTKISIYTTTRCPHCKQLKSFLQQHAIRFVEFNIEKNRRALKDFQRLGSRGVPVTRIGETILQGFNPGQLKKTLKQQGLMTN